MKYLDKFLKLLGTDRNTFFTYILTLFSIYICVDRLVEIILMMFTGISSSYWGPIAYTFAFACPIFAFLFSGSSKFTKGKNTKLSFFYLYCISLYIIALSMFVQWINGFSWIAFTFVPNFLNIVTDYSDLIKPAFTAIALYLPLTTFYPLFKWLFMGVNDTNKWKKSITDYGGIDLSGTPEGVGPYSCEVAICKDGETGKSVKTPEHKRYESTLVVGGSGTGKTSMVFEPMIAQDIEKKRFYREVAKEMGFTALKTGLAATNCPYDNEYMNKNFNLNMIKPNSSNLKLYNTYMNKLIHYSSGDKLVYKNLGITYLAPDYESTNRMIDVANNFNVSYNVVDPANVNSIGINPFVHNDPVKTAIAISSVLKGMYATTHVTVEEAFMENVVTQAIENLCILLKEVYPRLHNDDLPTLEDLLVLLNDFDLIEKMCAVLEADDELKEKYNIQLSYFKKNFFKKASNRSETEKHVHAAITQLDNLLRYPGIKNILCNRTNNIDFDKALENGEVTFVCTRRGDLGATAHKAFGLFFILLMQYSVLTRLGNEKSRIPHFLYIDEFPEFLCKATAPIFTLYRKYRVGTIISAQSISQFGAAEQDNYRNVILSNCSTKLLFGGNTPTENEWWSKEFGNHREWLWNDSYDTAKGEYDPKLGGIKWGWKAYFEPNKLNNLAFKNCAYKTKNAKGKTIVGPGKVDFLSSKYKEQQEDKTYNFYKFTNGIHDENTKHSVLKNKSVFNSSSDSDENFDPIQTDTTDSNYFFNSGDGITIDLKKKN